MLQEYQRILVAIDDSENAKQAFKKSLRIAKRNNATLYIAHVMSTRSYRSYEFFNNDMVEEDRKKAENMVKKYQSVAKKNGVENVEIIIEIGNPKTVLSKDIPKREGIDLIVIGATGLDNVDRFILGSTTESIIRRAQCDVVVIRADENIDEEDSDLL